MPLLHGIEVENYYVIAALQRTGSYLLCECLENTELVGMPTEALSPENMDNLKEYWGKDVNCNFREYITAVVENSTCNGWFGVKIHWTQIEWTRRQLDIGSPRDQKILDILFPDAKFIRMMRKDIRGQAISSYRAYQTEEWWKKRDVFNTQIRKPDPPFNSEKIRAWERVFQQRNIDWSNYFANRGIVPLCVEYDDLARDWRHETKRCLTFLGQDTSVVDTAPEPTLMRQADAVTRAWRQRLDEEDTKNGINFDERFGSNARTN